MKAIHTEILKGKDLTAYFTELTELRLTVFREYPYLYEGDPAFEKQYLSLFARSKDAFVILAKKGDRTIGAISGLPLVTAQKEIRQIFSGPIDDIYALCDIVVLKEYRSQKIGSHLYFEFEKVLKKLSTYRKLVFWQAVKPKGDPKRPPDYFPLDSFWKKQGFVKRPDLHCTLTWKEIGDREPTPKLFEFFIKVL